MPQSPFKLAEPQLTARERDVLLRLVQHESVREIANESFISVNTVKTHIKSIYLKLGVNTRDEAVRRAHELRLLPSLLADQHGPHLPSSRDEERQGHIDLAGLEAARKSLSAANSALGDERPTLETLAVLNPDALEISGLDETTYYSIRIATLVAMDAPASAYRVLLAAAGAAMSSEQAESALLAVADVVGSTRAAAAATYLLDAFSPNG